MNRTGTRTRSRTTKRTEEQPSGGRKLVPMLAAAGVLAAGAYAVYKLRSRAGRQRKEPSGRASGRSSSVNHNTRQADRLSPSAEQPARM
jgi:hypothetical protein